MSLSVRRPTLARATLVAVVAAVLFVPASLAYAATIEAQVTVNGRNVDSAKTKETAIKLGGENVTASYSATNTSSSTVTVSKITVDYVWFAPSYEIDLSKTKASGGAATIEPGATDSRTFQRPMPGFVKSIKGYRELTVHAVDPGGRVLATKTFWVILGDEGSPLTGPVGAAGIGLGAAGIGVNVAGRLLRAVLVAAAR